MSISGQIVSETVAQLYLENSIQTLLNFFGSYKRLTPLYRGKTVYIKTHGTAINQPVDHTGET